MRPVSLMLVLSFFVLSCAEPETKKEEKEIPVPEVVAQEPVQPKDTNHVTVFVRSNGTLLVNRQPARLKDLEAVFKTLKAKNGTVFYSREKTEQEPPKESIKVVDLVMKYQLPLQFYTDSSFTELVDFK